MEKSILIGKTALNQENKLVNGEFTDIEGEPFYKISNYEKITDFFISVVSNVDHWMFISSNGSLSAGRKNRDNALFPYYTVDRIHDNKGITGSTSFFMVEKDQNHYLWEPFTNESERAYSIERNIYKSFYGNKIIFEEINKELELSFRYGWYNSEKFGFVKKSRLMNLAKDMRKVQILDGIQNLLPAGIDYSFQNEYSNLLDAYKKNERIRKSNLGLFTLSAIPVDRAEPSESLYATTVWTDGLQDPTVLISNLQTDDFRKGRSLETETDIRARRGAYLVNSQLDLNQNEDKEWMLVAEVNQDAADVANLNQFILRTENIKDLVNSDIEKGTEDLRRIASSADALQKTDTPLCYARHFSNTLYNVMRGGVFANNYSIDKDDYRTYVYQINKIIAKQYSIWLDELPENITYNDLIAFVEKGGDADLIRITYEYLPLTFSRRHGDPSRPWNIFSIETRNQDGTVKYNYEGNWRDIFQNWEALCYSYPEFIEGIIGKFVNATTIDGYNPYRIMREGIDWETPDPDDPWAYIGYWGDHQIIYLQKLLELSNHFHPGRLSSLLTQEIFTYANVPYKIKPYQEIIKNPKDTIVFDKKLNTLINAMAEHVGTDAKVLKNRDVDKAYKANLMEKILVTLLSKLSNFIPEAGIWLNTQRPEWNDANNALVGNGTSMVTLYYLRRFLKFWQALLNSLEIKNIQITHEVLLLQEEIHKVFKDNIKLVENGFTDLDRRRITDLLGNKHSEYRQQIYEESFNGRKRSISIKELIDFIDISLQYLDQSITKNKRDDGLYHAYNLISIKDDGISIRNLYEMLEGQVALLSSGILSAKESVELLDSLKKSDMFRADQYSYMLYPDRELKRFTDKNLIPGNRVKDSELFQRLLNDNDESIIKKDNTGDVHFNSDFRNAELLEEALSSLNEEKYGELIESEKEKILNVFEEIFDHQSFTGRSGTFFGYEGLGSIYWHMVSKLLLATQECYFRAIEENADPKIIGKLKEHYYEIKAGIGLYKSPELYGAFPTDAYSHTPAHAGAKQPGLTGQVKEDVISRFGEMGVRVQNGEMNFDVSLLNTEEILTENTMFEYYNLNGSTEKLALSKGQIALTFCQVPVLISESDCDKIRITYSSGKTEEIAGNKLSAVLSEKIFKRTGEIKYIEVFMTDLGKVRSK